MHSLEPRLHSGNVLSDTREWELSSLKVNVQGESYELLNKELPTEVQAEHRYGTTNWIAVQHYTAQVLSVASLRSLGCRLHKEVEWEYTPPHLMAIESSKFKVAPF